MRLKATVALAAVALLTLLAPATAAAESDLEPEVLTVLAPLTLGGDSTANATDALAYAGTPTDPSQVTLTARGGRVHVTEYRVAPSCFDPDCQVPNPNGQDTYQKVEVVLTDATLRLLYTGSEFEAYLTTDPTYMSLQDGSRTSLGVTIPRGAALGVPTEGSLNNATGTPPPGWSGYPNYRTDRTDFRHSGASGTLTATGWFEIMPLDATFVLEGKTADGDDWGRTYTTRSTDSAYPTRTTDVTAQPTSTPETHAVVLEFGQNAGLTLTTEGPVAVYTNGLTATERGGGVSYLTREEASKRQAVPLVRAGDFNLEPHGVLHEGSRAFITLTLTPLAPATTAAPADAGPVQQALEDPAVATGLGVAGGALAAAALAYWWPALRYGLTALLLPLYTRIAKGEVLNHDTRDYIYTLIKSSPGIHAHEISARANIGWGTTVYHLKLLESHRMVVAKRTGRYKRFFVNDGRLSSKKEAYGILRNETSNKIAQYVLQHPGCHQKDVCAILDLKPSLVNWHMGKLEEAELVKKVKDGRTVRYYAGPAWNEMQLSGIAGLTPASAGGPAMPAAPATLGTGLATVTGGDPEAD